MRSSPRGLLGVVGVARVVVIAPVRSRGGGQKRRGIVTKGDARGRGVKFGWLSASLAGKDNFIMARTKECVRRAHADAQASQRAARRAAGIWKASRLASVEVVEAAQAVDQVCSWLHGARARPPPESLPCHAARALAHTIMFLPGCSRHAGTTPWHSCAKADHQAQRHRARPRQPHHLARPPAWWCGACLGWCVVRANFRSSFIETVLAARGAFVHIPTGCAQVRPPPPAVADHRDGPEVLAAQSTPVNSTAACPLVAYSQGGVDLCAAYGLASAVHCFGDTVAATAIARSARAALASGDAFGHIRTVVRSEVAGWSAVRLLQPRPAADAHRRSGTPSARGIRRRGQPCDCDLWRVRLRLGGRARPAPLARDARSVRRRASEWRNLLACSACGAAPCTGQECAEMCAQGGRGYMGG